ncbi:DUF5362 family protein [uncultured Polaribacter sp.]|uniref:DUF5362 family protein n=1 Tax=uncultured Polaribacter sp. TaxID=174711 RepID=UPI00262ACC98|nr:DUF5362 family protein [uncultured Polaribacter sp.]
MVNPITQLEQLTLNSRSKTFLKEISKWTFFFSIIGFVGIALMVLIGILMGTIYAPILDMVGKQQALPFNIGMFMSIFYIVMAIIYIFPVLYLFKFSRKMKVALASKSDDGLADAFEMLKSHYKFIGVFTIIILSLYTLLFVTSLFAGSLI